MRKPISNKFIVVRNFSVLLVCYKGYSFQLSSSLISVHLLLKAVEGQDAILFR
jgi:hypothetical protein